MSIPTRLRPRSSLVALAVAAVVLAAFVPTALACIDRSPSQPPEPAHLFDVQDPGFEYGLAYWTLTRPDIGGVNAVGVESGAQYPVYANPPRTVKPYSGAKALRLGNPALAAAAQRTGTYGVSQRFVPKAGRVRLAFRVFSWESRKKDHLVIDLSYGDQNAGGQHGDQNGDGRHGDQNGKGQESLGELSQPLTIQFPGAQPLTFTRLPIKIDLKAQPGTLFDSGWKPFIVTGIPCGKGRPVELSYSLTCDDGIQSTWVYFDEFNDAPVVVGHSYAVNEDQTLRVPARGVLVGASDAQNDPLRASVATGPSHGTLLLAADGSFVYTPAPNYHGTDSFTFSASDGSSSSNSAAVAIVVRPVNDAPVAVSGTLSTDENRGIPVTLTATDVDGDPLSYHIVGRPASGMLTGTAPNLTYIPRAFFNGTDSFAFVANDGHIGSNVAVVTIIVNPAVYVPVGGGGIVTNEDTQYELNLSPFDAGGAVLTYDFVSPTVHGTILSMGPYLKDYMPAPNYNGPDTITYTVTNPNGTSAPHTLHVTVDPVNDAPTADPRSVTTPEDTALGITLSGSDIEGSALTYAVVDAPLHGSLSGTAPNLSYTPGADYNGPDSFTFKVNDGKLDSAVAVVAIDVTPVNDAPVALPQSVEAVGGVPIKITLGATNVDGDVLTYAITDGPAHGSLLGDPASNEWVYESTGYDGPDAFTFRVTDAAGASSTALVSITVAPNGPRAKIEVLGVTPYFDDTVLHEGEYLELLGDESFCPDPADHIVSYEWTIAVAGQPSVVSTDPNVYYILPKEGTYGISLTVRDQDGIASSSEESTIVANLPAGSDALNVEVLPGQPAQLFGRFIDSGWLDTHTASWDFAGTPPALVQEDHYAWMGTGIVTGTGPVLAAGASEIGTLTITDDGGASSEAAFTVTAIAPDPMRDEGSNDSLLGSDPTPPVVDSGTAHLSYIQSAGDVDFFEVKNWDGSALEYNTQVLVSLKDLPTDYDLAVFEQIPAAEFGSMPGSRVPGSRVPGSRVPGSRVPGSRVPGSRVPGSRVPVLLAPADRTPGSRVPADRAPGSRVPGSRVPGSRVPWDQFPAPELPAYPLSEMGFLAPPDYQGLGTGDIAFSELGLDALVPAGTDVVAYSANRALGDEAAFATVDYVGARIFVAVVGANGAYSATQPYSLQIESSLPYSLAELEGTTPHLALVTVAPTSIVSTLQAPPDNIVNTLIVTAPERMTATYGSDGWSLVKDSVTALAARDDVKGAIIALPSDIYDAWDRDPYSVDAANAVANDIRDIIQAHLTPDTKYVVLVGNDEMIPQKRLKDQTIISNELYYVDQSLVALDTPLAASMVGGYDLTDDFYVDKAPSYLQAAEYYVPDLAIGRLVERPTEIKAVIDAYVAADGAADPHTSVVTGYDFFQDGATVIASTLTSEGLDPSRLISPSWTAADLKAGLLTDPKDLSSVNAHFAHYMAESANGFTNNDYHDLLLSGDVKGASGDLAGRIFFSIGCHSGLNVPDGSTVPFSSDVAIDPDLDFPQAMASKGAIFIGPTGYGLGDTAGIGGTERLSGLFAQQIGIADGVSVGDAVVAAKRAYLSGLAQTSAYDIKSCIDWTLYGLPMYRVSTPQHVTPSSGGSGSGDYGNMGVGPSPFYPSITSSIRVKDGSSVSHEITLKPIEAFSGTYYDAGTPFDVLGVDGRPLQPSTDVPLVSAGGEVHGLLISAGAFHDVPDFDPAIGTFATGWTVPPGATTSVDGFWPASPVSYNTLDTSGDLDQTLVLVPGQFRRTSAVGDPVSGTQRLYDSLDVEVLRSTDDSDLIPPTIKSVDLYTSTGDDLIAAIGMGAAPEDVRVVEVLAMAGGEMVGTTYVPADPDAPIQTVQVDLPDGATPTDVSLIVQVADMAGNVAVSTGKGATLRMVTVDAGPDQTYVGGSSVSLTGRVAGYTGLLQPVTYEWDFGDGTSQTGLVSDVAEIGDAGSAWFTVAHTYAYSPTPLTATFKVTELSGITGTDTVGLVAAPPPAPGVGYVAPTGSDTTGDGSAAHPWATIQYGVDHIADAGTVNVAAGTYSENVVIDRSALHLAGESSATVTIDGRGLGSVVSVGYETTNVQLSGLTLINGRATKGGGVFCDQATSASISDSVITSCTAVGTDSYYDGGGAVYGLNSDITLRSSSIWGNSAATNGGGVFADKVAMGSITISDSTIMYNFAGRDGGGVFARRSSVDAVRTTLTGNTAVRWGGGAYVTEAPSTVSASVVSSNSADLGGGLMVHYCPGPVLSESRIQGNRATDGAGMYSFANTLGIVRNCLFVGNIASGLGGGAWTAQSNAPEGNACAFVNNTVVGNSAVSGGGGLYAAEATGTVFNCIFSGNGDDLGGSAMTSYSYVSDGSMGSFYHNINGAVPPVVPPGFANVDDYRLLSTSACSDTGTSAVNGWDAPLVDAFGTTRPGNGFWDMGWNEVGPH